MSSIENEPNKIEVAGEALPTRRVLLAMSATIVIGVVLCLVAAGFLRWREDVLGRDDGAPIEPATVAAVRVAPFRGLPLRPERFAQQRQALARYRRIDPETLQIPITRAMELIVARQGHEP